MEALGASELARNWALFAAAVGGLAIAIWRAFAADRQSSASAAQHRQAQREHVTAMFLEAVGKLEDENPHVRLGAVLILREVTEAFPELSRPTVDLLASYLRSVDYGNEEPPPEVLEITRFLIKRGNDDAS